MYKSGPFKGALVGDGKYSCIVAQHECTRQDPGAFYPLAVAVRVRKGAREDQRGGVDVSPGAGGGRRRHGLENGTRNQGWMGGGRRAKMDSHSVRMENWDGNFHLTLLQSAGTFLGKFTCIGGPADVALRCITKTFLRRASLEGVCLRLPPGPCPNRRKIRTSCCCGRGAEPQEF